MGLFGPGPVIKIGPSIICHFFITYLKLRIGRVKADFQSVEFSERAEFLLFARENVALKLNR